MATVTAPTVKLNNGREMPVLGLGTWLMKREEGLELIKAAIDVGYRHFDTAYLYDSELPLGEAIREKIADGTIKREDVHITTKLWCSYAHPHLVVDACKKSLKNMGLDYVDLYLIHWTFSFKAPECISDSPPKNFDNLEELFKMEEFFPRDADGKLVITDNDYVDTWKEMEKCVQLGLAKSIGVSNFNSAQLQRVLDAATIKPVTNQVEVHPYMNQKKLIEFCRARDIVVTCYGPLAQPRTPGIPKMVENPTVVALAKKKNKTPAQIALRYLLQLGTIVIPKTASKKRLLENISVFDFSLTPEEMAEMDKLNCNERVYYVPGTEHHKHYAFNAEF